MKQRRGRTRRERTNADNLKAQRRQPCMRCGQPIDYSLPHTDPMAFIAGHIKSWINNPALREDPANLQQEHAKCGKAAHDDEDGGRGRLGSTSRQW